MFGSLLNTTSAKQNRSRQYPNKHHIRKRHWVLGSLVILVGSWITHSTTATISDSILIDHSTQFYSAQPEPLSHQADSSNQVEILPVKSEPPEPLLIESVHTVKKGETLGSIFKKRKLDLALPHHISQHEIAKQLVSLSIGKALTFRTNQLDQLKQISYPISPLQNLLVEIDDNSISDAKVVDLPFKTVKHTVSADIKTSLYEAALDAGLSIQLVMEMVLIFGWDIDFVQDIRSGDSFHVIYQDYNLNGEKLADGNILAAEFTTQNQTYRAVRFEDKQGNASYYTPLGESMLGTFLRSPVEFSRISSRFGNRKHPILKTWRAHKGVDYAARRGTPIRATADGKIILAGNKGGYGRTVVIRHAGRFSICQRHTFRQKSKSR